MLKSIKINSKRIDSGVIPDVCGVYFFKNKSQETIYIGKAKSLKNRISSYFRKQSFDWKSNIITKNSVLVDYIITQNDTESQLLEAGLIKKLKPKYNVLLKDGQPFLYIFFPTTASIKQKFKKRSESNCNKKSTKVPTIELVRNKRKKGIYFGPFLKKNITRSVFNYLLEKFHLFTCNVKIESGCLNYHLGICSGCCLENFDIKMHLIKLNLAKKILQSRTCKAEKELKKLIGFYSKKREFEKVKILFEYMQNLETIIETIKLKFDEKKYQDKIFAITKPGYYEKEELGKLSMNDLKDSLKLKKVPKSIDCFDISHFQGTHIVGACVRFSDGILDKDGFRKFKIKTLDKQDDCAALKEIITRRYKNPEDIPDIVMVDGGKGQLSALREVLPKGIRISLAKKEERLFSDQYKNGLKLDIKTPAGKTLIAIRDYTHHFAITFHRKLRFRASTNL